MTARRATQLSEQVAFRFVQLRKRRGMTREDLAAEFARKGYPSLTYGVIGTIESGRRSADGPWRWPLTVDELVAFADVFDTSPGELLDPAPCSSCGGSPPAGFTCNVCQRTSAA